MATLQQSGDSGLYDLSGDLTFATVTALLPQAARLFERQELTIDLSGVSRTDSAALALLLEWLEQASRAGVRLHFSSIPESLMAIARLSNVEALLAR